MSLTVKYNVHVYTNIVQLTEETLLSGRWHCVRLTTIEFRLSITQKKIWTESKEINPVTKAN